MSRRVVLLSFVLVACAAGSPSAEAPKYASLRLDDQQGPDGLVEVYTARDPGRLFVRTRPPHLDAYAAVVMATPRLEFQPDIPAWPMRHQGRLARDLSAALGKKLVAYEGWELVTRSGGDVVLARIQVSNIGREVEPPPGVNTTSRIVYMRNTGPVRIVVELVDSETKEPLLRFAQTRHLRAGAHSGPNIERDRVELAFDRVADDLGEQLQIYREAIARPTQ